MGGILRDYIRALRDDPTSFATLDYPGKFDFKYGKTGDDLYQVGDKWIRADEFGNFAAGYAAQHALGVLGHGAMIAGGVANAIMPGSGEHWSDSDSRRMINAGASQARSEVEKMTGRLRGNPLALPAGCGN